MKETAKPDSPCGRIWTLAVAPGSRLPSVCVKPDPETTTDSSKTPERFSTESGVESPHPASPRSAATSSRERPIDGLTLSRPQKRGYGRDIQDAARQRQAQEAPPTQSLGAWQGSWDRWPRPMRI